LIYVIIQFPTVIFFKKSEEELNHSRTESAALKIRLFHRYWKVKLFYRSWKVMTKV